MTKPPEHTPEVEAEEEDQPKLSRLRPSRDAAILKLRLEGKTHREISETLKTGVRTAERCTGENREWLENKRHELAVQIIRGMPSIAVGSLEWLNDPENREKRHYPQLLRVTGELGQLIGKHGDVVYGNKVTYAEIDARNITFGEVSEKELDAALRASRKAMGESVEDDEPLDAEFREVEEDEG